MKKGKTAEYWETAAGYAGRFLRNQEMRKDMRMAK